MPGSVKVPRIPMGKMACLNYQLEAPNSMTKFHRGKTPALDGQSILHSNISLRGLNYSKLAEPPISGSGFRTNLGEVIQDDALKTAAVMTATLLKGPSNQVYNETNALQISAKQ